MILGHMSLRNKLVGIIMAVASAAVILGLTYVIFSNIASYKNDLKHSASINTLMVADNVVSTLVFDDRQGAEDILKSVEAAPYIDAVYLFDKDRKLFAAYSREDVKAGVLIDLLDDGASETFIGNRLHVVQPVMYANQLYGVVYTLASTRVIDERIKSDLASVAVLLLVLLGVAYFLAVRFQKIISGPILRLSGVAHVIRETDDYSIRADKRGDDEIGSLYDSFNEMLDQIEARRVERDQAEDALRASELKYRTYISNAPNGVLVLDNHGFITEANNSMCGYTGYEDTELCRRSLIDLLSPHSLDDGKIFLETLLIEGKASYDMQLRNRDGADQYFTMSGVRLSSDSLIVFASDVTELKKTQEELELSAAQLETSNRELQDFASVASHDLQEPLRKVLAFGDRLKTTSSDTLTEKALNYLDRMQHAAGRMQILINDLLTFSRVTTKAQPHVPVDLAKTVQEVALDLEVRIEELGARVEIGELPVVLAEPLQMRQLIQNLLGNALKFHKPDVPPVVKIYSLPETDNGDTSNDSAGSASPYCRVAVKDNGIGFDPKYSDRIFGVFQRLHGRKDYEGTGVGLAVCRKIIDRHMGQVEALGTPGEGATFILTLPRARWQGELNHDQTIKTDYHPAG